ncbi:hypothetical protein BGZ60DRAFT_437502 [Tricladium varicosporioides]|nr:hypothetical protein BGZ60DRAFT_437502 [Hymenoscyphus varicosporioides]
MNGNMAPQNIKAIASAHEDFPQFDPSITSYSPVGDSAMLPRSGDFSSKKSNNLLPAFGDDAHTSTIDSGLYMDMPDIPSSPPILRRWSIVSAPAHYGEDESNRDKVKSVCEKSNPNRIDIDSNDRCPGPNFAYHGPQTPRAEPHDSPIKVGQTVLLGRPRRYHYFETMNPKIIEKIMSFIDSTELSYRGKMPGIIVAFRIMPKVYNPMIAKFYGQEAWFLHEGNKWQFRGMSKLAVSTIKNILMCVCCCHLTDGQGIWFHPSRLETEDTGLTKLQQVILMPFLPPATHISPHNCQSNNLIGEFERFVKKFPYFLSPFDKVLRIQVIAALEPWVRRKELVKGAQECKSMVTKINEVLGIKGKWGIEQKYRNWGRAMIMEWKAEKREGEKWAYMDWRGVADKVVGPYQMDFESLVYWNKFDRLPEVVGPEDIAEGCRPL